MTRVVVGRVYYHTLEGKVWKVKVTRLDKTNPERIEWHGVLAGGQHDVENGSKCWGYISELTVVPRV